jgi:hypothetical protein
MKDLTKDTVDELLSQFRDTCLAQYDSFMTDNPSKYNILFDYLLLVTRELKRRGVKTRQSLLNLFTDKNPQVRLQAANFVYTVAPVEAKSCLEAIAAAGLPNQSLAAGMTLSGLEEDPNCLDWI